MTAVLAVGLLAASASGCGGSSQALFEAPLGDAGAAGAPQSGSPGQGGEPGSAGVGAAGAAGLADGVLFDPAHVLEIEITLDPGDWDTLRQQTRALHNLFGADCLDQPFESPFTYVHADVTVDGERRLDVGVRKKGFLGSLDEDKPSLKIDLDEYVEQDLAGASNLTLNNAKQDPGYLNQCIAYGVFSAAGIPAPRCNFAHVSVNGKDLGVYVHVEAIKKPLLRRYFASDAGNLYEGTLSDFRDGWTATFEKKTNESDPTRPEIAAITAAAAVPDAELLSALDQVLELDAFFSLWAAEVLVEHGDGYSNNTNNFYAYAEPTSGKTTLLPWGADQLFGATASGVRRMPAGVFLTGMLAHRLYGLAEGRERFNAALRTILQSAWDETTLLGEVERMDRLISPFIPAAAAARHQAEVKSLRVRIGERRPALEALLAEAPRAPSTLRGSVCLEDIGSVSGSFSTTWGTAGTDDPFGAGTATLNVSVDDTAWLFQPGYVGAVAGPDADPASELPVSIGVPALRSDNMLALLYFGLKAEQMKPGDVPVDLVSSAGLLFEADPSVKDGPATVIGTFFGALHLDAASMAPGAPVSGSFDGVLYRSSLVGE